LIKVIDAKYKAHLVALDEVGWRQSAEKWRVVQHADLHQVLACAALHDAEKITATLVYPLLYGTWQAPRAAVRGVSRCALRAGGRQLRLERQGLPSGHSRPDLNDCDAS
jgi:hypothetical protein